MPNLSKSKYTRFCQCEKSLWLQVNKPEEAVIDDATMARFEKGNAVGDLAMALLGPFIEVTTKRKDGTLDLMAMIDKTKECIGNGTENIAEASFSHDGNYCAVDILHKTNGGYAIYEVKSTTYSPDKDRKKLEVYAPDIAYQKWVVEHCGINVTGTFLVVLNSDYVLEGELDIQQLFHIEDLSDLVANEYLKVPSQVARAKTVLAMTEEPETDLSVNCQNPYRCAFWQYCTRQKQIPSPSVFDLYRLSFSKKMDLYHQGIISFDDLKEKELKDKQQMQVMGTLQNSEHIDVAGIRQFLRTLSYPLYFLDFETMQPIIPEYQGTHPYQQITFQYSLHIIEREGGELLHKEFLGISGDDPRRALAERLCKDIPMNVCTLAYNKSFECTRIKELAEYFPDLSAHLLNIRTHIKDLLDPFQAGSYYVPAMGGSFSIKSVLPALFPDDPSLNYHNLDERVQNGGDAMSVFPKIKDMAPEEAAKTREALLHYCCLDTMAMVRVWQKMNEINNTNKK
jgi:hypothetical protein